MSLSVMRETNRRIERAIASPMPFFREAGAGPGIVCLHASASTSSQWRPFMDAFADRFRVLAPDLLGAGRSAAWPADRHVSLQDEAALLEPVFARAGDPCAVVAHSYGAAVALVAAATEPRRFRALAVYEPTLFTLLDAEFPPPNDADCFRRTLDHASAALDAADPDRAARCFVDYWAGEGTWAQTPDSRKEAIATAVTNIRGWAAAVLNEPTPLSAFAKLDIPILYMMGKESPPSARGVGRLLTRVLPRVQVVEFEGVGHMGPVTHPGVVNDAIVRFLEQVR
jgi:pimeloyl-ACP methyl ester carboxylesterase